jgi:hypothetical protein
MRSVKGTYLVEPAIAKTVVSTTFLAPAQLVKYFLHWTHGPSWFPHLLDAYCLKLQFYTIQKKSLERSSVLFHMEKSTPFIQTAESGDLYYIKTSNNFKSRIVIFSFSFSLISSWTNTLHATRLYGLLWYQGPILNWKQLQALGKMSATRQAGRQASVCYSEE